MTTRTSRLIAAVFAAAVVCQLVPAVSDAGKTRSRKVALLVKGWDCDD